MELGKAMLLSMWLLLAIVGSILGAKEPWDDLDDKRLGAIMGGALVDAAAMPLHWIYDTAVIAEKVQGGDPAFFSSPSCPFYTYPEGENTPYGQQTRVLLRALAEEPPQPHVSGSALQEAYYDYYGPEDAPCHDRQNASHQEGCYWDGSTKGFVANYKAGKRFPRVGAVDDQANAMAHMVPVVAALVGQPGLLDEVATTIRVTQDTDGAEAFGLAAARVLRAVLLGKSPGAAVEAAARELEDPGRERPGDKDEELASGLRRMLSELERPNFDVVKEIGQSCDYPFNLWTGSHLLSQISGMVSENPVASFKNATRQTILAGGDSGSRGYFVGAVLGAAIGEKAIPPEWKAQYLHYDQVLVQATMLIQRRSSAVFSIFV